MNFEYQYWYFSSALHESFCDSVVKYFNNKKEQTAVTGNIKNMREKLGDSAKEKTDDEILKLAEEKNMVELKEFKKKRKSNVAWGNEPWLHNEITPYIHTANKNANWNLEWSYCETIQFTKYRLNQHYGWHKDSSPEPYGDDSSDEFKGKIRKLSCIISLSDPSDYKGGELEFCPDNSEPDKPRNIMECKEVKPKGSVIVFPSDVYHQVKPITKGTRYSLVVWCLGKPFQ